MTLIPITMRASKPLVNIQPTNKIFVEDSLRWFQDYPLMEIYDAIGTTCGLFPVKEVIVYYTLTQVLVMMKCPKVDYEYYSDAKYYLFHLKPMLSKLNLECITVVCP